MATTHRKLRRKELRRPDEFQTFFEHLRDFALANRNRLIAAAVAVVVAVSIVSAAYFYERYREREAAAQFYQALAALNAKRYQEAQQGFLRLAQSTPGLELGRLARFYLASAYLAQNDNARARDALVAYLAHRNDPLFRSLALGELGVVYENLGDFKKAEAAYREGAEIPGPEQTRARIGVARMLAREGNSTAAIEAYREFLKNYPLGPERTEAMEALAQLGASPEAEKPAAGKGVKESKISQAREPQLSKGPAAAGSAAGSPAGQPPKAPPPKPAQN